MSFCQKFVVFFLTLLLAGNVGFAASGAVTVTNVATLALPEPVEAARGLPALDETVPNGVGKYVAINGRPFCSVATGTSYVNWVLSPGASSPFDSNPGQLLIDMALYGGGPTNLIFAGTNALGSNAWLSADTFTKIEFLGAPLNLWWLYDTRGPSSDGWSSVAVVGELYTKFVAPDIHVTYLAVASNVATTAYLPGGEGDYVGITNVWRPCLTESRKGLVLVNGSTNATLWVNGTGTTGVGVRLAAGGTLTMTRNVLEGPIWLSSSSSAPIPVYYYEW